jgi:hypothetical protein
MRWADGTAAGETHRRATGANELDARLVRAAFPDWHIGGGPGFWFAFRGGFEAANGPGSLLRCYLSAPDLPRLEAKLSLQAFLDSLAGDELAEVWRRVRLPAPADLNGAT